MLLSTLLQRTATLTRFPYKSFSETLSAVVLMLLGDVLEHEKGEYALRRYDCEICIA